MKTARSTTISEKNSIYICLTCLSAFDEPPEGHPHNVSRLIVCDPGDPADERRKPMQGSGGILLTRAPRWYLEAIGLVEAE